MSKVSEIRGALIKNVGVKGRGSRICRCFKMPSEMV